MVFAAAQGIHSLRSISEQCRVNIEYMWLLEGYPAPSHMTLGRFFHRLRVNNESNKEKGDYRDIYGSHISPEA